MFPPGRARFETTPFPTGSPLNAMTIGMVLVARFAAHDAGPKAMITSTLLATSSATSSGKRVESSVGPTICYAEILSFDAAKLA